MAISPCRNEWFKGARRGTRGGVAGRNCGRSRSGYDRSAGRRRSAGELEAEFLDAGFDGCGIEAAAVQALAVLALAPCQRHWQPRGERRRRLAVVWLCGIGGDAVSVMASGRGGDRALG
jgi:hypothetical protein